MEHVTDPKARSARWPPDAAPGRALPPLACVLAGGLLASVPHWAPAGAELASRLGPLGWMSVAAPAAGALLGAPARQVRSAAGRVGTGLVAPAVLIPALAWALGALAGLADPAGAGLALAGLAAVGAGVGCWAGCWTGCRAGRGGGAALWAALLLMGALLLHGAAAGWGVLGDGPPFGPGLTARLLDLSPVGLVLESGGVDWMRDPSIYDPAGTDRIGPDLRVGRTGSVAGFLLLVVGWSLAGLGLRPRR